MKTTLHLLIFITLVTSGLSQNTVAEWQAQAVKAYPELAVKDSPLNAQFVKLVNERKESTPEFFKTPDWPIRLAEFVHLESLAKDRERWPKQVTLTVVVAFPTTLIIDGKNMGDLKVKRGTVVDVENISTDGITVRFLTYRQTIPERFTDIIARLRMQAKRPPISTSATGK